MAEGGSTPGRVSVRLIPPPWWILIPAILAAAVAVMYVAFPQGSKTLVLQAVVQGVAVGSIYVLGASGLSLVYGVKKFANFAHGDMMTVGAYVAFTVNVVYSQNIIEGVVFAALAVAALGILSELVIFRRLERRGEIAALIASVGLSLFLQNLMGFIFFGGLQYFNVPQTTDIPLGLQGVGINPIKGIATIVAAIAVMVILHVVLKHTTLGKAMRACADDLDLARASGINTHHVILWTWGIAGALAGVAGVLLSLTSYVSPTVGYSVLLFIFAAVILGGIGSPYGAMIGGFVIGVVQKLTNVLLGSLPIQNGSAYEAAGAFVIMVLLLLLRPEGLMGRRRASAGRRKLLFLRRFRREATPDGD